MKRTICRYGSAMLLRCGGMPSIPKNMSFVRVMSK